MQLAAVIKARTLGFVELDELNQQGRVRLVEIIPAIVKRYGFLSYPTKAEDFDLEDKGITFTSGRLGDIVIDVVKVYSGLIYVETLSSTDDSQTVLLDILEWGKRDLNLTYVDGMVRNWAYVSQLTFVTDSPFLRMISPPLDKLAQRVSRQVEEIFGEQISYHPMNFVIGHDPRTRKNGIAPFSIQHRANTRFGENKYFSEAPLPSHVHKQFLEDLERDLL